MTREAIKKHWEVIKAYGEGKDIQFLSDGDCWVDIVSPGFLSNNTYRVKPEQKIVPFTSKDDIMGRVIKSKDNKWRAMIVVQVEDLLCAGIKNMSYTDLLNDYVFLDGSPCGKVQE